MIGSIRPLGVLAMTAMMTGCGRVPDIPGFATAPFVLRLPSGERLTGSVTTRLLNRSVHATDGRVTCSGTFRSSGPGAREFAFVTCSNGGRAVGSIVDATSFAGKGTLGMDGGGFATFQYGDAVRME